MLDQFMLYVVFPLIVGAVLGIFAAIYRAFAELAAQVHGHSSMLARLDERTRHIGPEPG